MAANAVASASTFKQNLFLITTNLPKIVLMQYFHGYVVPLYINYSIKSLHGTASRNMLYQQFSGKIL